jgi:hypothetical protein
MNDSANVREVSRFLINDDPYRSGNIIQSGSLNYSEGNYAPE